MCCPQILLEKGSQTAFCSPFFAFKQMPEVKMEFLEWLKSLRRKKKGGKNRI